MFKQIAIVGLGLIGGSIAKTVREKGLAGRITAVGRSAERLEKARADGLIDDFTVGCDSRLGSADLVIIGMPVRLIAAQARSVLKFVKSGAIVSDVGSVKGPVVEDIESCANGDVCFIGAHPIAGTENSGFEAALSDLFENRICVLTPTARTEKTHLDKLRDFWERLGSRVICMDVETHDRIFAAISHLPHMVAFALVNAIVDMKGFSTDILQYSAGGFKDFTRIAASDPVMWRDIALMNRQNILDSIEHMQSALQAVGDAVVREDEAAIEALFKKSRDARRGL